MKNSISNEGGYEVRITPRSLTHRTVILTIYTFLKLSSLSFPLVQSYSEKRKLCNSINILPTH